MDITSKRLRCDKCRCELVFPYRKRPLCGLCERGQNNGQRVCFLCKLKGGELAKTLDGKWVHLVCGTIACDSAVMYDFGFPSKRRRLDNPPSYIQLILPASALSADCSKCWGQEEAQYTVSCSQCHRKVHYGCFLTQGGWDYVSGFECGCRKRDPSPEETSQAAQKAQKEGNSEYEPIRAPTASTVLKSLFEDVIRLDEYRLFRKESVNQSFTLPDKLTKFASTLPDTMLLTSHPQYCSIPDLERSKKEAEIEALLSDLDRAEGVVARGEPMYVSNFDQYEDSLLTSLDFLYTYRVSEHFYFNISQVIADLGKLISGKFNLTADPVARKYINWFWSKATAIIANGRKDFDREVVRDWKNLIGQSEGIPSAKLADKDTTPVLSRPYIYVKDFEPVNGDTSLLARLQTSRTNSCSGDFCSDFSTLGPFDLSRSTWISSNSCRAQRLECSSSCLCDPRICRNRQLSRGEEKKLGVDVRETPTWGFDVRTYRTIMAYLRQPISDDMYVFIGKNLPKAINRVPQEQTDITKALLLIMREKEQIFSLKDKRYAKGLLNALEGLVERLDQAHILPYFALHPKGTGVICTNSQGIRANELIVPYIGELYSPSQWLERQDVTKSLVKKSKEYSGQLPDFYNIWLERHAEDPEGYDLLMIDPIVKGTFGSRLSHSCTPNCGTVAMVAQGRYTIGMYALEDIEYGQELTFDYHSVTESAEEHYRAVCLCASPQCRGYYLSLGKTSQALSEDHGFLHRIACVLRSSCEALTAEDEQVLGQSRIREDVLGGGYPWVRKWTALILKAIDKETAVIEDECERKSSYFWYLQNLAQSLDRIKLCLGEHCQRKTRTEPPLELATEAEIKEFLWGDGSESVKTQLKELYLEKLGGARDGIRKYLEAKFSQLEDIRMHLLHLRDFLRKRGATEWCYQGVSDMLHLYAFTRIWVRQNLYTSFQSAPINIRYCDITSRPPEGKTLESVYDTGRMKYPPTFVEGTMAGWFRHMDSPHMRLANNKRGTVFLPCLSKVEMQGVGAYTPSLRRYLFNFILRSPQKSWPCKVQGSDTAAPWTHFECYSLQGTPMLDSAILQDNWASLKACLMDLDVPAELLREKVRAIGKESRS